VAKPEQGNNRSKITVTVARNDGSPVSDARVELKSTAGGWFTDTSGQTDRNGQFTTEFWASNAGDYEIWAAVERTSSSAEGSSSRVKVTVASPSNNLPIPLPLVLLIIVVLVLVGAGAYLWTRTTLQLLPKGGSLPCDGKSTLPVKVQFIDGFRRPKRMKDEQEVEMEATSGRIEKVVIPAGKASADALLTSSTECGPVTVTARSGNQVAKADLRFEAEAGALDLEIDKTEMPADGRSQATVTIKVRSAEGIHITSQGEIVVELETTHGEVTSPVKIPPRTMAVTATLKAGDRSGTATVKASSGTLRGEAKIVFAELARRWCMWCGTTMGLEAERCPKCEKTPPSHTDTKLCTIPTCGSVLPRNANFCEKCGARQPDTAQTQ
jgi:ribosomal protein L40E